LIEPDIEPTNLSDTVVRGAGLAGTGFVLAQVITLGSYLVLSRLATPEDFGVFAAGAVIVSTGLVFAESGMLAAIIHRPGPIDAAASTAVVSTCAAGLGLCLLSLATAPLLGHFFGSTQIGEIAAVMSGVLLLRSTMIVPAALLQRRFSFLRRVVIEPVGAMALGAAAIVACANGLGAWGLVIGYYAAAVADVLLSWTLVRWRPRLHLVSIALWRELVRYGRFMVASTVIERASQQVPTLLLGRFVNTNALGQFRYADRIAATPFSLIVQAGSYVLFPAFARITNDRERFRAGLLRSLGLMCALAFPLGFLLIPLGVPAAVLLFGHPWREAGYAAMALAMVPAAGTPISFASEAFKADGKPSTLTGVHIVLAIASTLAMIALLPFGLVGVSGGISVGMTVGAIYALVRVHRRIGLRSAGIVRAILPPAAAAVLMAAALLPVEFLVVDAASQPISKGLALLGAEALAGLALYAVALRVFAPAMIHDLTSLITRLIRRGPR
jgi:O-antigen/teichoic acid export membrane protein